MSKMTENRPREELIAKEAARLTRLLSGIDPKKKNTVKGLIDRAAFMRVHLSEMETDLDQNGFTEWFSQGDQEPYQRRRPMADLYNTMNSSYQKIIKQLTDLLPKDVQKQEVKDGFDDFVNGREDVWWHPAE